MALDFNDFSKRNGLSDTLFKVLKSEGGYHSQSEKDKYEMVKDLIAKGADVNAKNSEGNPALMYAMDRGLPLIKLLIENGADVNAIRDATGETMLMWAAFTSSFSCDTSVMRYLINMGADVNAKDYDGKTALMLTVRHMFPSGAELLAEHGALVEEKDNQGKTALDYVRPYQETTRKVIKKLIEEKGPLQKDLVNKTPSSKKPENAPDVKMVEFGFSVTPKKPQL